MYQETILATAAQKNTLVVLPTGLGKTNVFLMLAAQRLSQYPNSKILLIGPTKPLIDQYYAVFKDFFDINEKKMAVFTGNVSPKKREELWNSTQLIFSTPQGLENDIISKKIDLGEVSLLGFDEAHRAVGNYSYVFVAKQYNRLARWPHIVAMTASPGSDMDKIKEVCQNLFIEAIEVRTDQDADVKPYIKQVDVEWVSVELPPPLRNIQQPLRNFLKSRFEKLRRLGILKRKTVSFVNKTDLLAMQVQLRARAAKGEKDFTIWTGISVLAEIMKVSHALELLETQGIPALHKYFEKINKESRTSSTKAIKNVVSDEQFKTAYYRASQLLQEKFEHPKLVELQKKVEKAVKNSPSTKIMIFNQYRDNALDIVEKLNTISGVESRIFVGQQKKGETGLSQKEQKEMLDQFRAGEFNTLVATSIGEEGLDIPKVDLVVFYEPVPSAIRQIQRRGRTGRQDKGAVIMLMTKDTRDEAYRWVASKKEKKMYKNLHDLKRNIAFELHDKKVEEESKTGFEKYEKKEDIVVFADYREKGSQVIKELVDNDTTIKLERLTHADYVLSSRVGVEFKTVQDFVDSIVDGRLLQQLKELKNAFERPLVVVEGEENMYAVRGVHPNAIHGMLATIAISYGIPILQTKHPKETSSLLHTIAKREQLQTGKEFSMHGDRKPITIKEQQEYIISSLPGVGPVLAKPLLTYFKSVKNVVNSSLFELQDVEGIGKIKAEDIKKVVEEEYEAG